MTRGQRVHRVCHRVGAVLGGGWAVLRVVLLYAQGTSATNWFLVSVAVGSYALCRARGWIIAEWRNSWLLGR